MCVSVRDSVTLLNRSKSEENGTSEKKSPKEPSPKLEPPPMVEKELEKVAEKPEKTKEAIIEYHKSL